MFEFYKYLEFDKMISRYEIMNQNKHLNVVTDEKLLPIIESEIQNPDKLISILIDINPKLARKAFNKMVKRLKNPKKTIDEVLTTLEKCGLRKSIEKFKNIF